VTGRAIYRKGDFSLSSFKLSSLLLWTHSRSWSFGRARQKHEFHEREIERKREFSLEIRYVFSGITGGTEQPYVW
jgi:hypothetical protein